MPAGDYDVYLVAKEPTPEKAPKNAPPPKMSAIKQTVNVPDFWNSELATSSVIVAQRIDPLPAPLTPQQQADRPYALGMMEIVPTFETKFTKKAELSTFMLIYNPKVDSANKPDVSVEYNFYQKLAGAPEKFFNKTNPQNLNGRRCRRTSTSRRAISCRAARPCRWRRSRKGITGSRSRSPTRSPTRR